MQPHDLRAIKHHGVERSTEPDHVLFCAGEPLLVQELARQIPDASVIGGLGLKLSCAGRDWRGTVKAVAEQLSAAARRDVRVAIIASENEPNLTEHVMLAARSLEQFVSELEYEWLRDVLARDSLTVQVQPIVRAATSRPYGYECLLRGAREDGSVILPAALFAAAGKLGCLPMLDGRARLCAIRQAAALVAGKRDTRLFINFHRAAIYEPAHCFASTINAIDAAGLRSEQVVFEVVEACNGCDTRDLVRTVQFLRDRGFRIAFDDIGTAFLSSPWLADLRPDYIKIDASLVRSAPVSGFDAKVVRDLAEAARRRGIAMVAKGIENEAQLRFITNAGISLAQGFLYARPAPVSAMGTSQRAKVA